MSAFRFFRAAIAVSAAAALTTAFLAQGPQSVLPEFRPEDASSEHSPVAQADSDRHAKVAVAMLAGAASSADEELPVARQIAADTRHSGVQPKPTSAKEPLQKPVLTERLAGDIQNQLSRVGCYSGAPTGDWDAPTQAAMSKALAALNARLSVRSADVALLALLTSRSVDLCGPGRPAKEPDTVISIPVERAPIPGMMSVGGPDVAPVMPEAGQTSGLTQAKQTTAGTATAQPAQPRAELTARRRTASPRHADTFFTHPLSRQP